MSAVNVHQAKSQFSRLLARTEAGEERNEETVDIFSTDWYREMQSKTTPGDTLKIYRENHGLTQARLGEMLGGIPRQHVSNMERGIRPVSIKTARKLAKIFKVSPGKFV